MIQSSFLTKDFDDGDDLYQQPIFEQKLNIGLSEESAMIRLFFKIASRYDDSLSYACFPALSSVNSYNSNSYAAGLLQGMGMWELVKQLPPATSDSYPGWTKPVPSRFFF